MILKFNRYLAGIFLILGGLLIISLSAKVILRSFLIITSLLILLITIPNLIATYKKKKGKSYEFYDGLMMVILAVILIFIPIDLVSKTIGTIIFVLSLIKLIKAQDKMNQFQQDLYRYIIALILIIVNPVDITKLVGWIIGLLLIVTGIILIFNIRLPKNPKKAPKPSKKEGVIDVDDYHVHHE